MGMILQRRRLARFLPHLIKKMLLIIFLQRAVLSSDLNFDEDDTREKNLHHHFDKTGEETFFPRDYKHIHRLWNWITYSSENDVCIAVCLLRTDENMRQFHHRITKLSVIWSHFVERRREIAWSAPWQTAKAVFFNLSFSSNLWGLSQIYRSKILFLTAWPQPWVFRSRDIFPLKWKQFTLGSERTYLDKKVAIFNLSKDSTPELFIPKTKSFKKM